MADGKEAGSSDKENGTTSDNQTLLATQQHVDFDDYETMEELDFEDEKGDSDGQKYINVLQTSLQQNVHSCMESDIEEGEAVDDGVDIEDGEISEVSKSEDLQKYSCRFFQRGKCIWGRQCRYLHLSDKGLYNMFDSPAKRKKPPLHNFNFANEPNYHYHPCPQLPVEKSSEMERSPGSMWDKALQEAKERIRQSKIRQEEGCLEEDMHVKVRKEERFVNKPASDSERVVRAVSDRSDASRAARRDGRHVRPSRSIVSRKYAFHSEWSDPWRRSKTPPKRKRLRSKSFTDSSSISSESSRSSRTSKDRTAKRFKTKESSRRSHRSSSSSSYWGSSRSRSSSPKHRSRTDRYCSRRKGFRSPSSSPPYYKRKIRRSPDSIVLPYKRPSRSLSPPTVRKSPKAAERNPCDSCSSSKSVTRLLSPDSLCGRRSDMSISPISDSSLANLSDHSVRNSHFSVMEEGKASSKVSARSYSSTSHNRPVKSASTTGGHLQASALMKCSTLKHNKGEQHAAQKMDSGVKVSDSRDDQKITKRDLLIQQLKAVEEAIARKKKSAVCST